MPTRVEGQRRKDGIRLCSPFEPGGPLWLGGSARDVPCRRSALRFAPGPRGRSLRTPLAHLPPTLKHQTLASQPLSLDARTRFRGEGVGARMGPVPYSTSSGADRSLDARTRTWGQNCWGEDGLRARHSNEATRAQEIETREERSEGRGRSGVPPGAPTPPTKSERGPRAPSWTHKRPALSR
jgi:hypothetical protein